MVRFTRFMVPCFIPKSFKQEIIALKSISLRKFSLLVSMYDFLKYIEKNAVVNLYNLPTPSDRVPTKAFLFDLDVNNSRDLLIYEMYLTHSDLTRKILMRNVAVHTARKIIITNNPTINIQIFNFKQGKMIGGNRHK